MGGYGSTRWGWHQTKATVEQCISIDITYLYRQKIGKRAFEAQDKVFGALYWTHGSSMGYELTWTHGSPALLLSFGYTTEGGQQQKKVQWLSIVASECNYGSVRYWFTCPQCQQRARKVYMRGLTFACRKCHNLTYASSQEAHQYDSFGRRVDIDMSRLEQSFKIDELLTRWHNKEHLTKGERRKVAAFLGVPLFMVRNKWYQPKTRLKRDAAQAKAELAKWAKTE